MPAQKTAPRKPPAVLVGIAVFFIPLVSVALEWSAAPSVTAGAAVNDNITLVTGPHDTVWSSSLAPQLTLGASSEQSTLSGQAQLNRIDYSGHSLPSHTDGLLNLAFTRQYETSQLSLNGNITHDSTMESELMQTGLVTTFALRTARTFAPSWAYSITERDTLNLGYNYLDVSYGNVANSAYLMNYSQKTPSITFSHAFTEKNKFNLSLDYSDYQTLSPASLTASQYKATTTSAQMGFSRDFTENLNLSAMAGLQKTNSTTTSLGCLPFFPLQCFAVPATSASRETGSLFSVNLQQTLESSQLTALLSRTLQPTGFGGLAQTDQLSGNYGSKLTPTLNSSLAMSIYKTQYNNVSSSAFNSRYYTITPTLSWTITQWWSANASYTRSTAQYGTAGSQISSNAINMTVTYTWPKISKSR